MKNDDRYSRNIGLFGTKGQEAIFDSTVGVVGLGGLGSHVAQQLAYLGVRSFTLIDDDLVSTSNLNRLIGATPQNVGTPKVDVAERTIKDVLPEASIQKITKRLDGSSSDELGASCDVVFSCVDNDLTRLSIVEHCAQARTPFFDLTTEIGQDAAGIWYGGRVLFSGLGERCPSCMELLDQHAMARAAMTSDQLEADARIYGVPADDLAGTGPSVVSLNGVIASLAVMEWMLWTTKIRPAMPLLHYRGQTGVVTASGDSPMPGCYYCGKWKAE